MKMLNSPAGKGTKGFFPVDKVYGIWYMVYGIRDTVHASHKEEVNIRFKKRYQQKTEKPQIKRRSKRFDYGTFQFFVDISKEI